LFGGGGAFVVGGDGAFVAAGDRAFAAGAGGALAGGDGTFCDWILGCGGGAASCREAM
jgi:hypothetical protein